MKRGRQFESWLKTFCRQKLLLRYEGSGLLLFYRYNSTVPCTFNNNVRLKVSLKYLNKLIMTELLIIIFTYIHLFSYLCVFSDVLLSGNSLCRLCCNLEKITLHCLLTHFNKLSSEIDGNFKDIIVVSASSGGFGHRQGRQFPTGGKLWGALKFNDRYVVPSATLFIPLNKKHLKLHLF